MQDAPCMKTSATPFPPVVHRRLPAAALSLIALAAPCATAQAGLPRQPPVRDTTTTARRDTTARPVAQPLPPLQVMGTLRELAIPTIAVTQRVSAITSEQAHRWQPRHLGEALASQRGLALYDDLGSPWKSTLQLRGFTLSPVVGMPQGVSVFVDGVPVNEADAAQVNLELLPLDHVAEIEVLPGTASLLGPNSLGGAINLITRTGEAGDRRVLTAHGGSFGARGLSGRLSQRSGGFTWYAGADGEQEAGWRNRTDAWRGNAMLSVARQSEDRGLRLLAFGARSRAATAGSLPLSVYTQRPDSNLTAGDFELLDQLHLALSGHRGSARQRVTATAYARRHDAQRFNVNQVNDPDVRGFSRNATAGVTSQWHVRRERGETRLTVRGGAGAQWSDSRIALHAERLDPGITTDVWSPSTRSDVFASAAIARGRMELTGGGRWDYVIVPFRNRLRPQRDTVNHFAMFNPHAAFALELSDEVTASVSAARSFRTPALIELACADPEEPCPLPFALGDDPPLDPVVASTVEATMSARFSRLHMSLTAYSTSVRNDIFLHPYEGDEPTGSTIDGYFDNIERTQRRGLEGSMALSLTRLDVTAHANVTDATFRSAATLFSVRELEGDDNTVRAGSRLPLVPSYTGSVEMAVPVHRAVRVRAVARAVGSRTLRGDEASVTPRLRPYTVADASVQWERSSWSASLMMLNVTGRRYEAFGTYNLNQQADQVERFLTPGMRRSVQLTVTRQW